MAPEKALFAGSHASVNQAFEIVLKPISHPELGDIRIDDSLFAIGRTEGPFAEYERELVAELSRRHARIFAERGVVYIADLDSKNGTMVNGVNVRQKPARLHHGDEICFGRTLTYRVALALREVVPTTTGRLRGLTLTPESNDFWLQPIVIEKFPFLISKTDDTFSRYRNSYPHQVNYVSRRHAHIFLKGGRAFVEDLGSTNGTFVSSNRLDEHAVPLHDGDTLAFGGNHFVYKVSLQSDVELDLTVTKFATVGQRAANEPSESDKTTFVAAADSFLDIFCVDNAQQQEDEVNRETLQDSEDAEKASQTPRKRSKLAIFYSELAQAFAGSDRISARRALLWAGAVVAGVAVLALTVYFRGVSERELKDLIADGQNARALTLANQHLAHKPDDVAVMALGAEALLKVSVPAWLARLKAGEFAQANSALADMKQIGLHNADAQSLLNELEWIGDLEKFVVARGGVDAPIRIYSDEAKIKAILHRWDDDLKGHQRALARISAYVPEFKDPYAAALSHLRKLEGDESVYLAAIERLNVTIGEELNRGRPENLEAVLNEYAERYPRLAGLAEVRADLHHYVDVESAARARKLGPLIALLAKVKFSTLPFEAQFRILASSRLPSPDVVKQYQAVSDAWRNGDANQALGGLEKMSAGSWADEVAKNLEHKKAVAGQFKELQQVRGGKGYEERLLSFYGSLDPEEDTYFIRATEADVGAYKSKALSRAQELMARAQAQWRQYRNNGAIGGEQRLESGISSSFRAQARLLTEAQSDALQGMRIYALLKAEKPAESIKLQEEIDAEADMQRRSLQELHMVLESGLLKSKLALIGGRGSEERRATP